MSPPDERGYGHFADEAGAFVITDPLPPRTWINYLSNRRLHAFISQNAGGLLWYLEPASRRLTRYHYLPAPADRPGFYVYLRDRGTGVVWNPHAAPTQTPLDAFACEVRPGRQSFRAACGGIEAEVTYAIPPADDVMLWQVAVTNRRAEDAAVQVASYQEFGLLEFMREIIGWCYLKGHFSLRFDEVLNAIRYDYHVFEAPYTPRMLFGCTMPVAGWDCSREAFLGRGGSLAAPAALAPGGALTNSDLPLGGHACATLGVDLALAPGQRESLAYVFALGDSWESAEALLDRYRSPTAVAAALEAVDAFWQERLDACQVKSGCAEMDRFVNRWNPYNAAVALEQARIISTDHMGTDSLRFRDTSQDALAVVGFDPDFAWERLRLVLASQTEEGGGCFSFRPFTGEAPSDTPRRSDNTVWPVYTVSALVAETGDLSLLEHEVPFREGTAGTVADHLLRGLRYIAARCGPHGLPTLHHADWNDGLAVFGDEAAESVMLGQQLVYACRLYAELARATGRDAEAAWCEAEVARLTEVLNGPAVWDGAWYRRLLLASGTCLGAAGRREGRIYLNPQSWAVISGVADETRGRSGMDAVREHLLSRCGLAILAPPYTGIPEPEDPLVGSNPGVNENGAIFCHANTWAIIAEVLLGRGDRAFEYYRQLLPEAVIAEVGADHYGREPYVYVSSIVGPVNERFGQAGISWLTGTAGWMYVAATQYILGIRPTLAGLTVCPCLPAALDRVSVRRRFRGCTYSIEIDHAQRDEVLVTVDGQPLAGTCVPPCPSPECTVTVTC